MEAKKKKAAARRKPAAPAVESEFVTYTIRNVPRAQWRRFAERLDKDGRNINWALGHFIGKVADGQFSFE